MVTRKLSPIETRFLLQPSSRLVASSPSLPSPICKHARFDRTPRPEIFFRSFFGRFGAPSSRPPHPPTTTPAEVDIRTIDLKRGKDQFVILASDGLWDVMSSEEAVQYVHAVMGGAMGSGKEGDKWSSGDKSGSEGAGSDKPRESSSFA